MSCIGSCIAFETQPICAGDTQLSLIHSFTHARSLAGWLTVCVEKMGAASIIHKMIQSEGVMCCCFCWCCSFSVSFFSLGISFSTFFFSLVLFSTFRICCRQFQFFCHFFSCNCSKVEVAKMWTTCCCCAVLQFCCYCCKRWLYMAVVVVIFSFFLLLNFCRWNFIGPENSAFLNVHGTFIFIYRFKSYLREYIYKRENAFTNQRRCSLFLCSITICQNTDTYCLYWPAIPWTRTVFVFFILLLYRATMDLINDYK